jgi:branched-chain amino acid transport system ATP-binding protein
VAAVLELDRVSARYGSLQVLRDVSLRVEGGSITALIGGNGSGKSTTLKAVFPIGPTVTGHVTFAGRAIGGLAPDQVVRLGLVLVPQGREIFARMTVEENLEMGAFTRRDRRGSADDMTRMFDLFPRLKERRAQVAGTMSGGEQQMLAIARALMSRPKMLLMDEPFAGLAPLVVDQIADAVVALNREGLTILLVEQNVQLALDLASYAYVMKNGQVAFSGKVEVLAESPDVHLSFLGGSRHPRDPGMKGGGPCRDS